MDRNAGRLRRLLGLPLLGAMLACGAGDGAIAGWGNSSNKIYTSELDAVAEALVALEAAPAIDDAALGRIYAAIASRAEQGDPAAALIVLRVAEEQRQAARED